MRQLGAIGSLRPRGFATTALPAPPPEGGHTLDILLYGRGGTFTVRVVSGEALGAPPVLVLVADCDVTIQTPSSSPSQARKRLIG